jgi:hypothetical protein
MSEKWCEDKARERAMPGLRLTPDEPRGDRKQKTADVPHINTPVTLSIGPKVR